MVSFMIEIKNIYLKSSGRQNSHQRGILPSIKLGHALFLIISGLSDQPGIQQRGIYAAGTAFSDGGACTGKNGFLPAWFDF